MSDYATFLHGKSQTTRPAGIGADDLPPFLYPFQAALTSWALQYGRSAIFADCGLGKTPIQLAWSDAVVRKTNKPVLILTPLAVSAQTCREADKFGVESHRSKEGKIPATSAIVTNYERLHYFNPDDFAGCVCDESSILKNFDGVTRAAITEFMRTIPYRLLCTATAAPNDWIELGTSSECLGNLGYQDMLGRFFKNDQNSNHPNRRWANGGWRFRGHAETHFWKWVCTWARAVRTPADLGFDDYRFALPPLEVAEHIVQARTQPEGWLFDVPAVSLTEIRQESRRTITERCEMAAAMACRDTDPVVCWCNLNDESKTITDMIPDAVEVCGADDDDKKEETFNAFSEGQARAIVTKPTIAGFGLNWQHCAHQTFFPTHSFEQWYQAIRRSWRFGQTRPVSIDIISTEGQQRVLASLHAKRAAAEEMFARLVRHMNEATDIQPGPKFTKQEEVPKWL